MKRWPLYRNTHLKLTFQVNNNLTSTFKRLFGTQLDQLDKPRRTETNGDESRRNLPTLQALNQKSNPKQPE